MPIYRVKKQCEYVQIHNSLFQDATLTWKAKGILAYLLSKPADWQVYQVDIENHAIDGREAVRSGIKELIISGYINRKILRDDEHKFAGYEYEVYEKPHENPENGFSDFGKPAPTNKEITKSKICLTDQQEDDLAAKQEAQQQFWQDIEFTLQKQIEQDKTVTWIPRYETV